MTTAATPTPDANPSVEQATAQLERVLIVNFLAEARTLLLQTYGAERETFRAMSPDKQVEFLMSIDALLEEASTRLE